MLVREVGRTSLFAIRTARRIPRPKRVAMLATPLPDPLAHRTPHRMHTPMQHHVLPFDLFPLPLPSLVASPHPTNRNSLQRDSPQSTRAPLHPINVLTVHPSKNSTLLKQSKEAVRGRHVPPLDARLLNRRVDAMLERADELEVRGASRGGAVHGGREECLAGEDCGGGGRGGGGRGGRGSSGEGVQAFLAAKVLRGG